MAFATHKVTDHHLCPLSVVSLFYLALVLAFVLILLLRLTHILPVYLSAWPY